MIRYIFFLRKHTVTIPTNNTHTLTHQLNENIQNLYEKHIFTTRTSIKNRTRKSMQFFYQEKRIQSNYIFSRRSTMTKN